MMQEMYAEYECGAGIIFVAFDDPLSCIRMGVAKQQFSSIGFYYTDTSTGEKKTSVVLVDIMRTEKPKWLKESSVRTLSEHPLVTNLAYKQLNPVYEDGKIDCEATEERNCCFRQSIASCLEYGDEDHKSSKCTRDILYQIFGINVDKSSHGISSVELINMVIDKMGESEKVPNKGGADKIEIKEVEGTNSTSKLNLLKKVSSCVSQIQPCNPHSKHKLIQSYIKNNDLFGELIYVKIPDKDPVKIEIAKDKAIQEQSKLVNDIVSMFTHMILYDQRFFDAISDGIRRDRRDDYDCSDEKKKLAVKSNDISDDLINLINQIRTEGVIDVETFKYIVSKHNDIKNKKEIVYKCDLGKNSEVECTTNKAAITKGCKTYTEFKSAIYNIHDHVSKIAEQIVKKETPVIDINSLIKWSNILTSSVDKEKCNIRRIKGEFSVNSVTTVTSETGCDVRIMLMSEEKIRISTKDPDVSRFTKCELREILDHLNKMSCGDGKLNRVKRAILERLN